MDNDNIENTDSTNGETNDTLYTDHSDNNDSEEVDTIDSLKTKNKSLYEQLKKAKGFERNEDGQWVKKPTRQESTYEAPSKKSDDFGYDVKAYLKSSGINSTEFDFVKTELKQSGMKDIDALLENDYFKARLEKHRALAQTANAVPKGTRNGGVPTDSVEYWMTKDMKDVPADMRIKVVEAREAKERSKGVFYNS